MHIENPARGKWQFALLRRDPELQGESPAPVAIRSLAFSTSAKQDLTVVRSEDQNKILLSNDEPFVVDHLVATNRLNEE